MIRKYMLPIVCFVGLLQSALYFDDKQIKTTVMESIHELEIGNITGEEFHGEIEDLEFAEEGDRIFHSNGAAKEVPSQIASDNSPGPSEATAEATARSANNNSPSETGAAAEVGAGSGNDNSPATTKENPEQERKIDNSPLTAEEKLERERLYYEHHFQQMSTLINEDTLLDWNRDRRRKGKYQPWLTNFDYHKLGNNSSDISLVDKIFFRTDNSLCYVAKIFDNYRKNHPNTPKPHVLLGRLNQDFGAFSSRIKGKTGRFKSLPHDWIQQGCSEQFVMDYINHPDTLAVFTIQFQKWNNPKVISIPLGLSSGGFGHHGDLKNQMKKFSPAHNRTELLMVNSKEWAGRAVAIQKVKKNFEGYGVPVNTYNNFNDTACPFDPPYLYTQKCFYWQMTQAKFMLSPSGLGVDCYRNWESMYLGAIPVLERLFKSDGWAQNTLADLPIAWVDDYKDLTPEFLEKEYDRIVYRTPLSAWKFEKLTRQYWIDMANSIVANHKKKIAENGGILPLAEPQSEAQPQESNPVEESEPDANEEKTQQVEAVAADTPAEEEEEEEEEKPQEEPQGGGAPTDSNPVEESKPDTNEDMALRAEELAADTPAEEEETEEPQNEPQGGEAQTVQVAQPPAFKSIPEWNAALGDTEKEQIYYDHHYQQISTLVNMSTLMDWNRDRRTKGKYEPWLRNFDFYELKKNSTQDISGIDKHFFRTDKSLCFPAKVFHNYRKDYPDTPKPHILISRLNQDFGAFSSKIKGKTAKFRSLPQDWINEGCSEQFIMDYINHPDTLAVFTNQFQKWSNPKVISLPLGLHAGGHQTLLNAMHRYTPAENRTRFLMVNSKAWAGRKVAIDHTTANFKAANYPAPTNTYNNYVGSGCPFDQETQVKSCYYWEMSQSKFILSPSGLGVDCYRNWEAIYMGAIPVLERLNERDGWFENTLADLPIAWVDDYKNLTPEHLQKEYDRIVHRKPPTSYKFEKMTRQYWIQMAYSILEKHTQTADAATGVKITLRRLRQSLEDLIV